MRAYRRLSIVCAGVAVLLSLLGACGSGSSTSTSTKPSRGFTGTRAPGRPGAPRVEVNCPFGNGAPLKNALDTARQGETIVVQGSCTGTFQIFVSNVTLEGGAGGAFLDGGGGGTVLSIFPGASATLNTIAIQEGSLSGIFNASTLTLINSNVSANTNGGLGGGIINATGGTLNLRHSSVKNNTAVMGGGGIYNQGTVDLSDGSEVASNTTRASGANGGGISNESHLTVRGSSVISFNRAANAGGIWNNGTADVQDNSSVDGNDPNNCAPQNSVPGCSG